MCEQGRVTGAPRERVERGAQHSLDIASLDIQIAAVYYFISLGPKTSRMKG